MPLLMIAASLGSCADATKCPESVHDFCIQMDADGGEIKYRGTDYAADRAEKLDARYLCECVNPKPKECTKAP